jgi:AraC-like DNA-binding protein
MNGKKEFIEVWRPDDLPLLEVRRGFHVASPVPRHWHDEYQLCLVQAGDGELNYRGTHFHTPPASLFVVYPGEVHSNQAYGNCSYRTMYIDPQLMSNAASQLHEKATDIPFFPTTVIFDQIVISQYLDLHIAIEQPSSTLERQSVLLNLLVQLISRFSEKRSSPRLLGLGHHAIKRAHEYLSEHHDENVSLEDLAAIANLSPFHFNRIFSEQMGMPPHAYQTQLRILRAKALLRKGLSIPAVAMETGFADQSHFTRHFKRLVAVTPGQYIQDSKRV